MKIRIFYRMDLFILLNLLFLIITSNAISQITVGSQNTQFRFEPFPFQRSKYTKTKSLNTIQGIQWIEKDNPLNPDEGNKMALKDNTGSEVISIKTINSVIDFEINDDFLYTLESECKPRYAVRIAKREKDKTRENQYISPDKYRDETTFHIRRYSLDNSSQLTIKSLSPIKGFPKPEDNPQRLFISTNEFILVYVYMGEDSTCNLRIDRYPFENTESKQSITIPNVPRGLGGGHNQFYFKNNCLYIRGGIEELPHKVICELRKIDIETEQTSVLLTLDNLLSYGIDDSKNSLYYVTGETEYIEKTKETIQKGLFINSVSLDDLSSILHKEKLPFLAYWGMSWDDNLKKFVVSLPENDERNESSVQGGGFFTIESR